MGTLTQSITGLASSDPVPGYYPEVAFAQGEVTSNSSIPKVLFIGPKLSSGTATANTVYQLGGSSDADAYGGTGSPVHRAVRKFTSVCKSANIYAIFTVEATAGVTADNRLIIANTATNSGVISYTLCGETIQVGVSSGDTATAIATDLVAEINLQTNWPVVAVKGTGATVDVDAKLKGTDGNAIRHRVAITNGITTTIVASTATLVGGTGADIVSSALTAIEPSKYDYIIPCNNITGTADARIGLIKTQILAQALPSVGIRQQVIVGHSGTVNAAVTFTAAANGCGNSPRFQTVWQQTSEWEPIEVAAQFAAVRFNSEIGNPVYNYDFYGLGVNDIWNVPVQYSAADFPTRAELQTAIASGLTPIAEQGGKSYVVRACTASTDVRVRDTSKVTTADKFTADLGARYVSQWAKANVQDDPANSNVQVAPNVCTPSRLKTLTIVPLYVNYANAGWLDSDRTFDATNGDIAACATGIDPNNGTRINARIPLHVTKLLHQFAAYISENSSA